MVVVVVVVGAAAAAAVVVALAVAVSTPGYFTQQMQDRALSMDQGTNSWPRRTRTVDLGYTLLRVPGLELLG